MKKILSFIIVFITLSALFASCAATNSSSSLHLPSTKSLSEENKPVTILIAAAASLEYSYKEKLIPLFQSKYSWITVEGSYDSSGKLQTQIEEGLGADIFMSASPKHMNALAENGFIDKNSIVNLLENEIVLITGSKTKTNVVSFETINEADTIALGDTESVPVGQYSMQVLQSLGLWSEIQPKISFATNVTEVLNWVAEGSAEVGIVYSTDAATTQNVEILSFAPDGSLDSPVIYPVAILSESKNAKAAQLFLEFLQSPEALSFFVSYGFKINI